MTTPASFLIHLIFFILCTRIVTFSNQHVIPVMYDQRPLFYRERAAGVYGPLAYVLSCDTPYIALDFVTALFFSCLVYPLAGLKPGLGE